MFMERDKKLTRLCEMIMFDLLLNSLAQCVPIDVNVLHPINERWLEA